MFWLITKAVISGIVIAVVSEIARRAPRAGGLILSLPIVSLLAFLVTWVQHRDLTTVTGLARETPVLVVVGLPFFLPLAFAGKLGLGFWPAFIAGIILASCTIGLWLWLGPRTL